MGSKRSAAKGAALGLALCIAFTALAGWWVWKNGQTTPPGKPSASTNSLDIARATNVLNWLNTNFLAPTNLATQPTTPPPQTNRVVTNRFPVATTNLLTVRTSTAPFTAPTSVPTVAPQILKPSTNVATFATPIDRPVRTFLEAQVALARLAISAGPIDGIVGSQTRAAIRAFQMQQGLTETGDLDATTKEALTILEPVYTNYVITPIDLARLRPLPATWLGKSEAETLEYENALELVAEKFQASHNLVKSLNPSVNWTNVSPFTTIKAPNVTRAFPRKKAAFIQIWLAAKVLEAFDTETNLIAHFPCSIASRVEKRPVGQLTVVTGAENPNYTFDPAVFPESEEAQQIERKLIIPPGPNNPVGTAWITLDKPGYGIHGTPRPDQVGRTESHGCFRLANWNAEYLLKLVEAGTPVYVEP